MPRYEAVTFKSCLKIDGLELFLENCAMDEFVLLEGLSESQCDVSELIEKD